MKLIKTIAERLFCQKAFDAQVNETLSEGWTLKRRDIIQPSESTNSDPSNSMLYAELEYSEVSADIKKIFDYIDKACSRQHGDSFWIDENGLRATVDSSEAIGWWYEHMKPELERVIDSLMKEDANA